MTMKHACERSTTLNIDATQDGTEMADVGTKLLFENERVRVWEVLLEPGESLGSHTHQHDDLFYPTADSTMEVTRATGVERAELRAGEVYYFGKGDTHAARNVGDRRFHEILVELKG